MNRRDHSEEPPLDPLAQRLLELDEALESGFHGKSPSDASTANALRDATAAVTPELIPDEQLRAEQCLELIEAIRVTSPRVLAGVFDSTGDDQSAAKPATLSPATHLGRFALVRQLGQGGYGIVFLARDPTLGREVALKVPRPEVLVTSRLRNRFLREAEAAAALDHRNVVSVYEAGMAGPICYIASAYCAGGSLSAWLHQRGQVMEPKSAAQLIATLADAAQHAHDRGILHRDIKPSNVLIDIDPATQELDDSTIAESVQLADFGLARVLQESAPEDASQSDAAHHSMTVGIVGTPAYMAPEQAANRREEISAATDVYALGATFYHLLAGKPPIVRSSQIETLAAILVDEPSEPCTFNSKIPRDLSAICMKAIAKEPRQRYATASDLQADLERFLRGEQVVARPISAFSRLTKWCRRNPQIAALAATAACLAILTLTVALLGWTSTSRSLTRERVALAKADQAYQETKAAVDQYFTTVSENRLLNAPGMTPLRKELLAAAVEHYELFVQRHDADEAAATERRKALVRIAQVQELLGDFGAAKNAYEQTLDELDKLASDNDSESEYGRGTVLRKLAHIAQKSDKLAEATKLANRSVAIHRELLEKNVRVQDNRYQLAQALSAQATMQRAAGSVEQAAGAYLEGERLLDVLVEDSSSLTAADPTDVRLRLAQMRGNRSIMLRILGQQEESRKLLESSANVYQDLANQFPNVASYQENLGKAHANLSLYHSLKQRFEPALDHLRKATELFDKLGSTHSQIALYQLLRASTRKESASMLVHMERAEEAEQRLKEAIEIFESNRGKGPSVVGDLADARLQLGEMLIGRGEMQEATKLIQKANQSLEANLTSSPNDVFARIWMCRGYYAKALLQFHLNDLATCEEWLDRGDQLLLQLKSEMPANPSVDQMIGQIESLRAQLEENRAKSAR